MHKKLAASLTIAIFLLGTLAILAPVQAHFTLGDYTNASPFHQNDFDPHVPGVIGYVWPGSGQNAYTGYVSTLPPDTSPGYQSPWTSNPPDAPSYTWYQLQGNAYAPFGAILVNSTGDLIFAINATSPFLNDGSTVGAAQLPVSSWKPDQSNPNWGWGSLDILIPPEFGSIKPEQVVSTITNDYSGISVTTLSPYDRYAPGWTLVQILPDGNNNAGITGAPGTWEGWLFNSTATLEWYYVRINGVTAPSIAGKYFFKMFLGGNGASGECSTCQPDYWVPTENWPVLLVKGEIDPAIIWGTIMYGGYNTGLYGNPIMEAGKVWAHMTTKLDPYTGQALTGYPLTDAVGYFNATANGHYEVEGVAPGVYDIYASAGGFPQQLIASGVTILKGQSLNLNGYLNPGVVIHGDVYSKHGFGEQPWQTYSLGPEGYETLAEAEGSYIKIEIYANPTVGNKVDPSAGSPVSWSPLPCVAGAHHGLYFSGDEDASYCGTNYPGTQIEFPWGSTGMGMDTGYGSWNPSSNLPTQVNQFVYDNYVDEQGVGPAQSWSVAYGQTTPFYFQFGEKGLYGAPRDLDGHVPQMNATWVNGLTAGRYYMRAWVGGYVQTEIDGATFHEVVFDVAANEWAGDINVPIDLHLTSYVVKTVHFHDTPGTLMTQAISTGASVIDAELVDASGVQWAWASSTCLESCMRQTGTGSIYLFGYLFRWDGEDYGIPAGTYTPKVYALGYVQQTFEQVSLSLSGTPVLISDHLYRGVGFNVTIYSTDFEQPRIDRTWKFPGDAIDLVIYDEPAHTINDAETGFATQLLGAVYVKCSDTDACTVTGAQNGVWWGPTSSDAVNYGGTIGTSDVFLTDATPSWSSEGHFESGQYSFRAFTYGYVQKKTFTVYALKGQIADIKVNLVIGVNLTLLIPFKTEGIFAPTPYDMSARVRVFDDSGMIVGEWMTSQGVVESEISSGVWQAQGTALNDTGVFNFIPGGTSSLTVAISGLSRTFGDFGDPVFDQAGFEGGDYAALQNIGIDGSPNYQGGYSVEVDFVPWYYDVFSPGMMNVAAQTYHEPFWWLNVYYNYYTGGPLIVPGLLLGESFHTVPGHPQNPFGWTEVGALSTDFLGHSMAPNHLGPYAQEGVWSLPNAHLSGEASGEWEVDLRGFLSGTLVGFTWSGEFRTVSWATVSLLGADGFTYNSYSYDGEYGMFANPGTYTMTIAMPGYTSLTVPMSISTGQVSAAGNLFLQQSNIPIPEFSGIAIVAFSALAASLYLLRRRRQ